MELLIDGLEVVAHGFVAEGEVVGDFFGGHAFGETLEDLAFAGGEAGDLFFLGFNGLFEGLDEQAGDVLTERGTAFAGLANACGDVGRTGGYEEVAVSSRTEGSEDFVGVVVDGEDDEGGGRHVGVEMLDHLHARHSRKFEVDDDDIRFFFENDNSRLGAFEGACVDEAMFLFLEQFFQEEAQRWVIFDNSNSKRPADTTG